MKPIVNFIAVVFVVVILVSMLVGGYYGFLYLWDIFAMLSLEIRVALLTSIVTVLVSVFVLVGGLRIVARRINNGRLTELRHELYSQVLSSFDVVLMSPVVTFDSSTKLLLSEINLFKSKMFLLAGSDSLDIYLEIIDVLQDEDFAPDEIKLLVNKLISNFRGDLGYPMTYSNSKEKYVPVEAGEYISDKNITSH